MISSSSRSDDDISEFILCNSFESSDNESSVHTDYELLDRHFPLPASAPSFQISSVEPSANSNGQLKVSVTDSEKKETTEVLLHSSKCNIDAYDGCSKSTELKNDASDIISMDPDPLKISEATYASTSNEAVDRRIHIVIDSEISSGMEMSQACVLSTCNINDSRDKEIFELESKSSISWRLDPTRSSSSCALSEAKMSVKEVIDEMKSLMAEFSSKNIPGDTVIVKFPNQVITAKEFSRLSVTSTSLLNDSVKCIFLKFN